MQKLIILKKQLNNCEWEIEVSSYNKEVIEKAKTKLKEQGIKYKTEIIKKVSNLHPYRVSFKELEDNVLEFKISINILNCLENENIDYKSLVIRKTKESFTVYLWEVDEHSALYKAKEIYRVHKEYVLRKSV